MLAFGIPRAYVLGVRFLLLSIALLGGCAIDSQPQPIGTNDNDQNAPEAGINQSAIYYTFNSASTLVAGTPGAVPGVGQVTVTNQSRAGQAEATSDTAGSFYLVLNALVGDALEIHFLASDKSTLTFDLQLELPSEPANLASPDLGTFAADAEATPSSAFSSISLNDRGEQVVTVFGTDGSVAPGIAVVICNITQGVSVVAYTSTTGSFSAEIKASSGNELVLFATEPANSNAGSAPVFLMVP